MKTLYLILLFMGGMFTLIGSVVGIIFASAFSQMPDAGPFLLIPMLFVVLGLAFIGSVFYLKGRGKRIRKHGRRYEAKIYGYVRDHSIMVNGSYPVNVKVHYFDEHYVEKEAIIPTQFTAGSGEYAIGMTMDIYEYQGKYSWDPASVSNKILAGEEELMDDKPVEPEKLSLIAVTCNHCGSSFKSAKGYAGKCPYCGNYINIG